MYIPFFGSLDVFAAPLSKKRQRATTAGQSQASTPERAWRETRAANSGWVNSSLMARANPVESPASADRQLTSSGTIFGRPPDRVVTTQAQHALASSNVTKWLSLFEVFRKISPLSIVDTTAFLEIRP